MTGSESTEQNKQQDAGKKPIEIKEEDLVCEKKLFRRFFYLMFSRKKINN